MSVPRRVLDLLSNGKKPGSYQWQDAGIELECEPTNALPGSVEKIVVLRSRVDRCQALWHKDDPYHEPAVGVGRNCRPEYYDPRMLDELFEIQESDDREYVDGACWFD